MDLPFEIKNKLESLLDGYSLSTLKNTSFLISESYKSSDNHLKDDLTTKVYSVVRFPATYSACYDALSHTFELVDYEIKSLVDVGGGSGASSLAASTIFPSINVSVFEKEEKMIEIGKYLFSDNDKVSYKKFDVTKEEINDQADLVVASYLLNELDEPVRLDVVKKMWESTDGVLLIVEPGTAKGFEIIRSVRDYLSSIGGEIIAPCPNIDKCPMKDNNWCHFSSRVNRSKLHKTLKEGDSPFEDEKYSYIAFCKKKVNRCSSRILRHPNIYNGYVELDICSSSGENKLKVSKKDKEAYKLARKAKAGDKF